MSGVARYQPYICRIGVALTVLFLVLARLTTAWAGAREQRVFDYAELFDSAEAKALEDAIEEAQSALNMDFAIVTASDAEGKSASEYAESYYLDAGLGVGNELDGALLLMDMDNHEIYLLTSGRMIALLPNWRVEKVLDDVKAYVKDGDYYHAANIFIEAVYDKPRMAATDAEGESGEKGVKGYEVVQAFAFAGIVAGICCWRVKRKYGMAKEKARGQAPLMIRDSASKLLLSATVDQLLEEKVVQTEISDDSKKERRTSVSTKRALPRDKGTGSSGAVSKGGGVSAPSQNRSNKTHGHTFGGRGRKF